MKYTNKQIKRLLYIQEFIETSNTLAKVYNDFENKEYIVDTFTARERIYKVYCASIYNSIKAIQESKEMFISTKRYNEFEEIINQKYIADDNKYYSKDNYETTLFKIIESIRNQTNHSLHDDDDNNILFEEYIDFETVERLRNILNDVFYEIYKKINKKKVKKIVLNKPRIRYSFDKISNKLDELKLRIPKNENRLNEELKRDSIRAYELFDQLFDINNLYDLYTKEPETIKMFEEADKEIQESSKRLEKYIAQNGTELEKEAYFIFKKYINDKEGVSIKDINNNIKELQEKLSELKEKEYKK